MKLIGMTICAAALCVASLGADAGQTSTKSKVTVKDGKDVDVTGCVASASSGSGDKYMLTNVADKKGAMHSYMLASDDDLGKHVGHRVQISGKAADRGDGKVEIETKTKTKVEHGDDKETKSKSTMEGDLAGMPFLSVKSLKMIAASCP
ncbi:MAG TPA: hypothetical protein VKI43_07360 [Vicinamibacterales bacterium]|nr:hypothetical protein [Vicinamibacterales bacterium]